MKKLNRAHYFYLFEVKGGGKKLGYGTSAEDALEVLSFWHKRKEMDQIIKENFVRINQREMKKYANELI